MYKSAAEAVAGLVQLPVGKMNCSLVNGRKRVVDCLKLENIELGGVNTADYPDFCDAFVAYAELDGNPLSDAELEQLNNDSDFVLELVLERFF